MSPEPNLFLLVRGARQILPGRDANGVALRGEFAPARAINAAVATCLANLDVRS